MTHRKKNFSGFFRVLLIVLTVAFCVLSLFRGKEKHTVETVSPDAFPEISAAPSRPSPTFEIESEPSHAEAPVDSNADIGAEEPREAPPEYRPIVYDSTSYQLVSDMVYAYRNQVENLNQVIAADVSALKAYDSRLGEAWGSIMEYWDYADNRMPIMESLPDKLPEDDSLCIVVLGFQLQSDGRIAPELQGRCELALKAAQQYPNAYIVLTGGGTALDSPSTTEAGVMADWFRERGIEDERLILENRSQTTEQNARFTLDILTASYPQIKSLVIVSSDYHLPLGCLMFTEAALLYQCEYGVLPFHVEANLALRGYGLHEYTNPAEQARYVWSLANPTLGTD